jgi:hypothetical protein
MDASRTKLTIGIGMTALAVGGALGWLLTGPHATRSEPVRPADPSQVSSHSPARPDTAREPTGREAAELAAPAPLPAGYDLPTPDPAAALERAREEMRTALEASLHGTLDPEAILDAALALGHLEVDTRAFSEPDPSGCTVYPLIGAPAGTRAELWVGRSSKPEVQRVLSLRIELDAGSSPYLLEGCSRSKAVAQLQMQLDHAGRPLNLSILTDFPPSRRNRDLGIPLEQGEIAQGVLCSFDADDPSSWRARRHGLEEGLPGSWEEPALLLAGRWPAPEKLDAFGGLLQRQFETVRH